MLFCCDKGSSVFCLYYPFFSSPFVTFSMILVSTQTPQLPAFTLTVYFFFVLLKAIVVTRPRNIWTKTHKRRRDWSPSFGSYFLFVYCGKVTGDVSRRASHRSWEAVGTSLHNPFCITVVPKLLSFSSKFYSLTLFSAFVYMIGCITCPISDDYKCPQWNVSFFKRAVEICALYLSSNLVLFFFSPLSIVLCTITTAMLCPVL